MRWGRPSSWRGRGHGLAFSLRAPRRGTIFFLTFNQDSSVPNHDRSPRHPPRSPAGRGRPLSISQCFAGRYFSRGSFGKKNSREKKGRPANRVANRGNEEILSGKMGMSPRKKTSDVFE